MKIKLGAKFEATSNRRTPESFQNFLQPNPLLRLCGFTQNFRKHLMFSVEISYTILLIFFIPVKFRPGYRYHNLRKY